MSTRPLACGAANAIFLVGVKSRSELDKIGAQVKLPEKIETTASDELMKRFTRNDNCAR